MKTLSKEQLRQQRIDAHYRSLAKDIWKMVIIFVIAILVIFINARNTPSFTCPEITVTIQKGDTLDGIVRKHCKGTVTNALDILVNQYGATIYPFQTIALPTSDR